MTRNKKIAIASGVILIMIGISVFAFQYQFSAPQKQAEAERFVIALGSPPPNLAEQLKDKGLIRSEWAFNFALNRKGGLGKVQPGGYKISKSMTAWGIAEALTQEPYMKWVVIPEGLRKEQIAERLAGELGWTDQQKSDWVTKYTAMKYDETEGVYFPDTYLLPKDETPLQIADRLRAKFNEKFQPYADKFLKANIKWTTALKIASIVQREAAGKEDMPLIAGIIWNRLLKDMKLETDATIQYINDSRRNYLGIQCAEITPCGGQELVYVGNDAKKNGWWQPIKPADTKITSPYNTYLNKGLPPHPICNPGLDAIDAVLNSAETECLYYLHDSSRQIHCAKTYEEHQANIEQYLLETITGTITDVALSAEVITIQDQQGKEISLAVTNETKLFVNNQGKTIEAELKDFQQGMEIKTAGKRTGENSFMPTIIEGRTQASIELPTKPEIELLPK